MIVLLITVIFVALAAYAIGRTVTQESIFDEVVQWVKGWAYYPVDGQDTFMAEDGSVVRREPGTINFELMSPDGYRTDKPRWQAFILGKVGDLFTCVYCFSAQVAFWLGLFTFLVPGVSLDVPIMIGIVCTFAGIALTYMINDWLNPLTKE